MSIIQNMVNGFKETEIGLIPSSWNVVTLKHLVEVKGGKRLPQGSEYSSIPTPHAYIRVVDFANQSIALSNLKFISPEIQRQVRRYTITKEDVYISIAGTVGLVGIVPDELSGANLTENAAKLVIKDKANLDKYFLVAALMSSTGQEQIDVRTMKTSQPKLALMRIEEIPIPLPPLLEQRRIAAVLSAIQRDIAAQDTIIAEMRAAKRSLMLRVFTYGPGESPALTKITESGEIPIHWETQTIGKLCDTDGGLVQTGPFGSQLHSEDYVMEGIPSVMPQDIVDNRIVETNIARVSAADHQRLSRYHLRPGDIVYARRGDIGRRALVTDIHNGWLCGTGSLFIRIGKSIYPPYLHHYLGLPQVNAYILSQAIGTTMLNLNTTILRSVAVAYPEVDEQQEIATTLDAADAKIATENRRRESLRALFRSALHELLTGQRRLLSDDGLPMGQG